VETYPLSSLKIFKLSQAPVAHTCHPSYLGGKDQEDRGSPRQIVRETLSQKYPTQNRAGRVAQVVEHLPSKPGSNPSTAPKKEKKLYYKNYTV
jgi:hypothetical protein